MASRVIHVRLSDITIAQCYNLIESLGARGDTPMSSAVSLVLDAAIAGQVKKGVLRDMTKEEALIILDSSPPPQVLDGELDFDFDEGEKQDIDKREIADAVHAAEQKISSGGTTPAAPDNLPPAPVKTEPWDGMARVPFKTIRKSATIPPEITKKIGSNEVYKIAFECVCAVIDKPDWGSERCLNMTTTIHDAFIKAHDV